MIVKLMRRVVFSDGTNNSEQARWTTKIVECVEVDVHELRIEPCPTPLKEISIDCGRKAFYLADPLKPRPTGFADEVDFWSYAYIENSNGATTEKVFPK